MRSGRALGGIIKGSLPIFPPISLGVELLEACLAEGQKQNRNCLRCRGRDFQTGSQRSGKDKLADCDDRALVIEYVLDQTTNFLDRGFGYDVFFVHAIGIAGNVPTLRPVRRSKLR